MSQATLAPRTAIAHQSGALSAATLFAVIDAHNDLTKDVHQFCALADGDAGITDVNYEAVLTAAQISHSGYVTDVATPAPKNGLFGTFPVGVITEELADKFTAELANGVADFNVIVAKLNLDTGLTAVNFHRAVSTNNRLVSRLTTANALSAQDGISSILTIAERGHGHGGFLLAAGTPDTGLAPRIMRSVDGGRSWRAYSSLPAAITAIVGIVQWREKLFLFGNTAAAEVVYVSTDYGLNWTAVTTGVTLTSNAFTDAIVLPGSEVILAAGEAGGEVLRSADGGRTWTKVLIAGPTGVLSLGYSPGTGKVLAGGNDGILYSSANIGVTFAVEEDFTNPTSVRYFLELANGYWLVTTRVAAGVDELMVSWDYGATWKAPVAVTGAQGELDKMIEGPDGTVYIAVGTDVQVSYDKGATVVAAADGVIFPANDTLVSAFGRTLSGNVVVGTTNATDFAGLWLLGTKLAALVDAYRTVTTAGGALLEQLGGGVSGTWQAWTLTTVSRLIESWQALGAMMDLDGEIVGTTYQGLIAARLLTKYVTEPEAVSHNVGHGSTY